MGIPAKPGETTRPPRIHLCRRELEPRTTPHYPARIRQPGQQPRFIISNLDLPADTLCDDLYCPRGETENRIKEIHFDLFGTRTSCHKFLANWLRVLFAGLVCTLMQGLKTLVLQETELATATSATIRSRLLKIGATVLSNTR